MPYLYAKAIEAHESGVPVMRAMILEFPKDPASDTLERQYMLGEALLVAPVFCEDGVVAFYLPEGRWTHLVTGEVREGGRWQRGTYGFLEMPLYVRPGAVVALGAVDDKPDYQFAENITFAVYGLEDGVVASAPVYDIGGKLIARFKVRQSGRSVEAELEGSAPGWRMQLVGVASIKSAAGGDALASPLGVVIASQSNVRTIHILLDAP
jgi:alpha-D-xyloside xylohydrolase